MVSYMKILSGKFVVVFPACGVFQENAQRLCNTERYFFPFFRIYVLKPDMYGKLYVKLDVQEILTHTKSKYQDTRYSLCLSLVMTAHRSYLIFFSSILYICIYVYMYVCEFSRETVKVVYLGSRRTGAISAQLYA